MCEILHNKTWAQVYFIRYFLGDRKNTLVPTLSKKLKAQYDAHDYTNDAKANASENVKSRDLMKLSAGDNVRMQPIQSGQNEWREATVDKATIKPFIYCKNT